MTCFKVENLSFRYNHQFILENISFEVFSGDNVGLIGPNGCGKTTLLKLLDRNLNPTDGNIFLFNKNLRNYKAREIAQHIAFVPQSIEYVFPFSVQEIVLMGRAPFLGGLGFENENDYKIASEVMEMLNVYHLKDKSIQTLSGGEKQRVLIARALCQQPKIIILDEPNAHLDISHQLEIFSLMKKMNKEKNLTIISVSHDLNLASMFNDKLIILKNKKVVDIGATVDILTQSNIMNVFNTKVEVDKYYYSGRPRITILPN